MTHPAVEVEARDQADEAPLREKAGITQVDPASIIKSRIERMRARIAKWDQEAARSEPLWIGWPAYWKFCDDMAEAAREKKAELVAEVRLLTHGS